MINPLRLCTINVNVRCLFELSNMRRESISENYSSFYFATQIGKFLYFTDVITTGCNICSCIYLLSLVFAGWMLQSNPENHEHLPLIYIFSHVNSVKTNEVQNETKNLTATKLRVINTLGVCCGKVLQFVSDCSQLAFQK